jgi:phospholipase/carboxylesterase
VDLDDALRLTRVLDGMEAAPERELPPHDPLMRDGEIDVRAFEGHVAGLAYIEVVLGDADPEDELPLVVYLHGRGDRPRVPGGPFLDTPGAIRLFIPRALERHGDGYSWLPTYARSGQYELFASALVDAAAHVARAIRAFVRIRPTRGQPIVVGFSQGGHLAWALAVLHPDVVGSAFPLAGWLPASLVPETLREGVAYPSIRSLHGALDHPVPVELTRETTRLLRERGLSVELVEVDGVGHEMTHEMDARFHAWLVAALAPPASRETQPAEPAAAVQ